MPDSFRFLASLFEEGRTIICDDEKDAMLCLEKSFRRASTSKLGFSEAYDAHDVWYDIYTFYCNPESEAVDEDCKKARTVATKAIFHAALATADIKAHRDSLRELLSIALVSCQDCLATVELRPILEQLMCYGTIPASESGPSGSQLTLQDLERSVAFLGDCIKDEEIMLHLNHKVDLVDGLFDCIVWALEDSDPIPWTLYHASLFVQVSAGTIFAKSIRRSAAQLLYPDKRRPVKSPFVGPPGFSLEKWSFWTQRLSEIREKWEVTPAGPGLLSLSQYAKEALRAMEDVEDRAVLGVLRES